MIGRVVSVKSKNTATILVERIAKHPLYKKTYVQSKKYLVDDKLGVSLGDIVEFINCKPVSKRKSFRTIKILGKNFAEIAKEHLKEKAEAAIAEVMPEEEKGEGESGKGKEVNTEVSKNSEDEKNNKRKNRKENKQEEKGK